MKDINLKPSQIKQFFVLVFIMIICVILFETLNIKFESEWNIYFSSFPQWYGYILNGLLIIFISIMYFRQRNKKSKEFSEDQYIEVSKWRVFRTVLLIPLSVVAIFVVLKYWKL